MENIGIKVENLSKTFGTGEAAFTILKNASFEIKKGEFVALVAPSGAGKTTLLMMIGCVEKPTSGKIWLGNDLVWNEDHWSIPDTRRIRCEKLGFIFQAHYLIPFLNVIENVILIPLTNGIPRKVAEEKAMELLKYFDIADKAYNMPSELSGGQNQRAAIARALSNDPQIILADEPTAALDMARAIDVVKMLKKLAVEQNVAVIMVTHDERLLSYCDRVLTIKNKKVVEKREDVKII
ncbi:ABC transporter ATP-binding protein [Nitratiruptor sp. SB155-2]|uniref:ABC transporter ATP-binding protein n=1 Tax=Nitratiruptor sp. (strain SB155-2) TaxID=387092 RepID=UPI0001586EE2|nr:ABC transporter ATP-binding protein [Nitratiruptor sp. SB155-2]BAF69229.1 ABC transporter, ATP-binding protein [Nitratiruptor sp. SB155-2]